MSEKEKEAIELLESFEPDDLIEWVMYRNALSLTKNLIDKQNKELNKLKSKNKELLKKLRNRVKENNKLIKYSNYKKEFSTLNKQIDKQNKVIDEMIKWIDNRCFYSDDCGNHCEIIEDSCYDTTKNWNCKDCIKQYFIRKVEEDGK